LKRFLITWSNMNELALFAGAGGGLLASELLGWRTRCAVEYDAYRRSVLLARQNDRTLPSFPVWDDARTFDGKPWRGLIDVVSGGFPCQPFSSAARGRNNAIDLWPEMRRIVEEVRPGIVYAENVIKRAIDHAGDDLEAMGYKTVAISLSAKDVGADHVRPRCWLLAYSDVCRELLRTKYAEACLREGLREGVWSSEPDEPRMADGLAHRVERIDATGNGQVPIVAASAFLALVEELPDHPEG
jgi:DNA (cytosine-5)-methyltransferase 1